MSRFKTLLLRQWMQHHRGWLNLALAPVAAILLGLAVDTLQLSPVGFSTLDLLAMMVVDSNPEGPAQWLMLCTVAVTAFTFFSTWLLVILQAPGTARLDLQDRSIEFWLSLPTADSQSVGASLLMQLLLVPLLGLGVGYVASQIVGFLAVISTSGSSGLMAVPWSAILAGSFVTLLRVAFGVALASLWLMPIVLLAMVASVWLKRWGVPSLVVTFFAVDVLLRKAYDFTLLGDTVSAMLSNAWHALIQGGPEDSQERFAKAAAESGVWPISPQWLLQDAFSSIRHMAQPLFVFALAMSAVCIWLVMLRRRRA